MPKTNGAGKATTLSPAQLDKLLAAAPTPEHRCLWAVMRFTGSRVSETLKLTWGALHADRLVFVCSTTKTRITREPRISPQLNAELECFRDEWKKRWGHECRSRDHLIASRFGPAEHMSRAAADLALRQTIARIGLPSGCSLHTFRRSFATTAAQNGAALETIRRFTGHRSLDQLSRYIDVSARDEEALFRAIAG
jgi:integrase/recombinase XerD